MSVANEQAVKYEGLQDSIITNIKTGIELFVKSKEYWDKFAHHSPVPKGHKKFTSRRLVKPKVKPEDIRPSAEFIAPRPTKIAMVTLEKTVFDYRDKAIYSYEDMTYHFDDTVENIRYSLQETALQKQNLIKGKGFISTRAIFTYDTSMMQTLRNAAKILRKNGAKRWDGKHYLAHMTLEEQAKLRAELTAANEKSEKLRLTLEGVDFEFDAWEDWIISVPDDDEYTLYKNDSTHYLVCMGRRGIDGASPVDVAELEDVARYDIFDNGLGHGVLQDEDGNYTSDDNKQQGSVALNILGLGVAVSDDLCILRCEVSVNTIHGTALPTANMTGYVSHSGNEIEIGLTAGSNTEFALVGARYDATASKYYGSGNTVVAIQVKASSTYTLGTVAASNWTATYKNVSGGSDINADILAVVKTDANYDTLIVRIPNNAYSFAVVCTATAS